MVVLKVFFFFFSQFSRPSSSVLDPKFRDLPSEIPVDGSEDLMTVYHFQNLTVFISHLFSVTGSVDPFLRGFSVGYKGSGPLKLP